MTIPVFLDPTGGYRDLQISADDVQDIIDNLYTELVTWMGWTCTLGGIGSSPTTFKSPGRADGLFFTVKCTRISATRIAYEVRDQYGVLVNNDTDTRQDINVAATDVWLYCSPFYVIVDSDNVAQDECWGAGLADRSPELISHPRPVYWASRGPRTAAGTVLTYNNWAQEWILAVGATSYTTVIYGTLDNRRANLAPSDLYTLGGTLLFWSCELIDALYLLGRRFNLLLTDEAVQVRTEWSIPLDFETLGTFRVLGWGVYNGQRTCIRVA